MILKPKKRNSVKEAVHAIIVPIREKKIRLTGDFPEAVCQFVQKA